MKFQKWNIGTAQNADVALLRSAGYPYLLSTILAARGIVTAEDAAELLTSLGWNIDPAPVETMEVVIPAEFSDVYEKYNELQISQGFDLSKHAGKTATRWTMSINGHPSGEEEVYATLLVINTRLVGGDICAARLDGFMHGLCMPK